jgi:hypothetical protein
MSILFISHSSNDNAQAIALQQWLKTNGWDDVFLDLDPERGISAGERWEQALIDNASRCEVVLLLISSNWLNSSWCVDEFTHARRLNKRIFGLLLDDITKTDLPNKLKDNWQLVPLFGESDQAEFDVINPRTEERGIVSFSTRGLLSLKAGLNKAGLNPK